MNLNKYIQIVKWFNKLRIRKTAAEISLMIQNIFCWVGLMVLHSIKKINKKKLAANYTTWN